MFRPVYEEIRQMTIAKVLDFYDHEIRQLNEQARQEKYDKMSLSPFRFFRGSSHLFYYDVTRIPLGFDTPRDKPTWIQGDLHFENFGVHGNAKGEIIYDINDFDEGYLGSYLYDLIRMAVSVRSPINSSRFFSAFLINFLIGPFVLSRVKQTSLGSFPRAYFFKSCKYSRT